MIKYQEKERKKKKIEGKTKAEEESGIQLRKDEMLIDKMEEDRKVWEKNWRKKEKSNERKKTNECGKEVKKSQKERKKWNKEKLMKEVKRKWEISSKIKRRKMIDFNGISICLGLFYA